MVYSRASLFSKEEIVFCASSTWTGKSFWNEKIDLNAMFSRPDSRIVRAYASGLFHDFFKFWFRRQDTWIDDDVAVGCVRGHGEIPFTRVHIDRLSSDKNNGLFM